MKRSSRQLRDDAIAIWQAGVDAVLPSRLIPEFVAIERHWLHLGDNQFDLDKLGRIAVVGGGKAGAAMTVALEEALGDDWLRKKQVEGWVNVPADCLQPTHAVHLHAARPAGLNEPTAVAAEGTRRILKIVSSLGHADLCIILISGGGSALLPVPIDGMPLSAKIELTREIAARGGDIEQLNTVRRELSLIKGGGLARVCRAGNLVSLILSDVLGDDPSLVASGPSIPREPTPERAIEVLRQLELESTQAGQLAIDLLEKRREAEQQALPSSEVTNIVIGNNATAVDAAGVQAERLGYSHAMISAGKSEGRTEDVAERLTNLAIQMRDHEGPDCLISGGEPTVALCDTATRGLGGRNQQLVLAALVGNKSWEDLCLLSGGTDGEDGPTDAAGALVDAEIAAEAARKGLEPYDYLERNDAYHFFESLGGLFKTGPTHTNVCDLRVVCVSR